MIGNLLNLTCDTERPGPVSDGRGGWPASLSPVLVHESCAVQTATEREAQMSDRFEGMITHKVYLLPSADVRRGDVLTSSNGVTGRVLEVVDDGGRQHHRKLWLDARQLG